MLAFFASSNAYVLTQPPAVALAAPARAVAPQMGVRATRRRANHLCGFRHQFACQPNFRDALALVSARAACRTPARSARKLRGARPPPRRALILAVPRDAPHSRLSHHLPYLAVPRDAPHSHLPLPPQLGDMFAKFTKNAQDAIEEAQSEAERMFAEMTKASTTPGAMPSASDIEEYCRDPESSGCDIEMVEAMMAECEKLKEEQSKADASRSVFDDLAKAKGKVIRWSAATDAEGAINK
jgi:hypothetical protein